MIIVRKSVPIDSYEQYKRVINQITEKLCMHIYITKFWFVHLAFGIENNNKKQQQFLGL